MGFRHLFFNINWMWFSVAVIVTFAIGAVWFSALFSKNWVRIFKVEMPEKPTPALMIRTLVLQFVVNVFFGLLFFMLTPVSVYLSVFALIVFCAWQKGMLNFQFPKFQDFVMAAVINVGYTFVVGIVFILFALI
jgi:hypothetical protein